MNLAYIRYGAVRFRFTLTLPDDKTIPFELIEQSQCPQDEMKSAQQNQAISIHQNAITFASKHVILNLLEMINTPVYRHWSVVRKT
jgi:hypothetical protein